MWDAGSAPLDRSPRTGPRNHVILCGAEDSFAPFAAQLLAAEPGAISRQRPLLLLHPAPQLSAAVRSALFVQGIAYVHVHGRATDAAALAMASADQVRHRA